MVHFYSSLPAKRSAAEPPCSLCNCQTPWKLKRAEAPAGISTPDWTACRARGAPKRPCPRALGADSFAQELHLRAHGGQARGRPREVGGEFQCETVPSPLSTTEASHAVITLRAAHGSYSHERPNACARHVHLRNRGCTCIRPPSQARQAAWWAHSEGAAASTHRFEYLRGVHSARLRC